MYPQVNRYLQANQELLDEASTIIFHLHLNASTGVASVISNLVPAQRQTRNSFVAVIDLFSNSPIEWKYDSDVWRDALRFKVPNTFGTLQYIYLYIHNPIRRLARELSQLFPKKRIIFHFHSAWLTGAYLPLPKLPNVKYVATIHGIADEHKLRKSFIRRHIHSHWARKLHESQIEITSVSKNVIPLFKEIFNVKLEKLRVVYNGISLIDRVHSCRENNLVFGFVGQIEEGKGWKVAIESYRIFQSRVNANAKLLLVGKGKDVNKLISEIENESDIFYLGAVEGARLKVIPYLDCLLLPSWSEGLPMVVLEASSSGVPTISTRVGDLDSLFIDGFSIYFSERNSLDFAKAMQKVHDHRAIARFVGVNSEVSMQNLSIETMVNNFEKVYE